MEQNYVKPASLEEAKGKKRITGYCCVPQCNNYYRKGLSFHVFPKKTDVRKKWEVALKMGKPTTASMVVCGDHFTPSDYFPNASRKRLLYPHAVPSQKLPVRPLDRVDSSPMKRRKEARGRRAETRQSKKMRTADSDEHGEVTDSDEEFETLPPPEANSPVQCFFNQGTHANLIDDRNVFIPHEDGFSMADMLCANTCDKTTQVNFRTHQDKSSEPSATPIPVNLADILSSDSKLYTFTGIHSLDMLQALVECVADIDEIPSTNKKSMLLRDRIILTMVKLKTNMSFTAIAILFGITRQTCSNYFRWTCPLLARVLETMIPWPDQETIRCNLPSSFENFLKTRIIMDCAETTIEKCHCLKCRVLTYSHYKKNHTAKFCVCIAPSGLITHISRSFGGRASDKFIVNQCGVLDKLEVNDAVMVDKGFNIDHECLERHVKLIRPPFLRQKKQLSKEEALLTAEIARARVHVERVIQRLREFGLLQGPIPWHIAPYFDDCLVITAGLTNLGPPVMNIDKFM